MCLYVVYNSDNISNTTSNFTSWFKNAGFILNERNAFSKLFITAATTWSKVFIIGKVTEVFLVAAIDKNSLMLCCNKDVTDK